MTGSNPDDVEWISWDEASRRTGIRVPTIEHAVRVDRIRRRPAAGTLPTLDAASVEAWAEWYREKQRHRTGGSRRERSATEQLPPGSWLTTSEAAQVLGIETSGTVMWHARRGDLEVHRSPTRYWVSEASVLAFAADRAEWVSWATAAAILGCRTHVVERLVARGHLEHRSTRRTRRSINRASVETYAPIFQAERSAAAQRREQRRAAAAARASGPPQDGEVWFSVTTAALVIGLTPSGLLARIRQDAIPATRTGRRWWLRRRDVEQASAAAALYRARQPLPNRIPLG